MNPFYIKAERLPIPHTRWQYEIDKHGNVYERGGITPLTTQVDKDGDLTVEITWLDQKSDWKVSLLVAHTFLYGVYDFTDKPNLKVLFIDRNNRNFHPSNLEFYTSEPLESGYASGYYVIPGYSRFIINPKGELISTLTRRPVGLHVDAGYVETRLKHDQGKYKKIGIHRLLGLAFLHPSIPTSKLVLNHKDGNKRNNDLSNLEWVTRAENNQHAIHYGLTNNNQDNPEYAVLVRDLRNGSVSEFGSINQTARYYGLNPKTVHYRLYSDSDKVYYPGLQFAFKKDFTGWREPTAEEMDSLKPPSHKASPPRKIVATHIDTKEVRRFATLTECAKELNLSRSTLKAELAGEIKAKPREGWEIKIDTETSES